MKILYVHGLGGTKNGSTSKNLKEICNKNNIDFYSFDVPFDPIKAVTTIINFIKENNIDAVISSSLGAFYTLNASLRFDNLKTIVINPAFDVYNDILNNFGKGIKEYRGIREDGIQQYELNDNYYEALLILKKVFDREISNQKFDNWYGYFSTNDEYFSHKKEFEKFSKNIRVIEDTHHIGYKNLEYIINELLKGQ